MKLIGRLIGLGVLVIVGFAIYAAVSRDVGEVVTEKREVPKFDRIILDGIGTIRVTDGDQASLSIQGQEGVLDHVKTKVRRGRLTISYESGWLPYVLPTKPLRYIIEVPRLKSVHLSGAGRLESKGLRTEELLLTMSGAGSGRLEDISADSLEIRMSGAGSFKTDGEVDEQIVSISGAGSYKGLELRSTDAEVDISGAGRADMWATEELAIRISGAGRVRYKGDPDVEQDISGTGNVKKLADGAR